MINHKLCNIWFFLSSIQEYLEIFIWFMYLRDDSLLMVKSLENFTKYSDFPWDGTCDYHKFDWESQFGHILMVIILMNKLVNWFCIFTQIFQYKRQDTISHLDKFDASVVWETSLFNHLYLLRHDFCAYENVTVTFACFYTYIYSLMLVKRFFRDV